MRLYTPEIHVIANLRITNSSSYHKCLWRIWQLSFFVCLLLCCKYSSSLHFVVRGKTECLVFQSEQYFSTLNRKAPKSSTELLTHDCFNSVCNSTAGLVMRAASPSLSAFDEISREDSWGDFFNSYVGNARSKTASVSLGSWSQHLMKVILKDKKESRSVVEDQL